MAGTDGRRLRGERSRAQILKHATAIASTEGLEGLSIGRVAVEAGVGKGNIQVLFGDKEALQLATLENAVNLYRETVVAPAMEMRTPIARLTALIDGWFDFVGKQTLPGGCFINAVSSEYRAKPGHIRDRINEYRAGARKRFADLIRDAQETGELSPDLDVDQLVFELAAFQAIANIAALMGDTAEFQRAKASSINLIHATEKVRR